MLDDFRKVAKGEHSPLSDQKQFQASNKPAPKGAYEADHEHEHAQLGTEKQQAERRSRQREILHGRAGGSERRPGFARLELCARAEIANRRRALKANVGVGIFFHPVAKHGAHAFVGSAAAFRKQLLPGACGRVSRV